MTEAERPNSNRMVLLLIAGLPVTVILLATWLWFFVARGDLDLVAILGTANRGVLVQPPRRLAEAPLHEQGGAAFSYGSLEPRWTMLVPVTGIACDAACEHTLYVTRQIHVALGKEFNRVRRILVSEVPVAGVHLAASELSDRRPAPPDLAAYLAQEQRGLEALVLDRVDFERLFPEYLGDPGTWYLVDPAGWIMMAYNAGIPYKDVMSDLKFLLKNSGE